MKWMNSVFDHHPERVILLQTTILVLAFRLPRQLNAVQTLNMAALINEFTSAWVASDLIRGPRLMITSFPAVQYSFSHSSYSQRKFTQRYHLSCQKKPFADLLTAAVSDACGLRFVLPTPRDWNLSTTHPMHLMDAATSEQNWFQRLL